MIWQHDAAPPHYGQRVRDYLDKTFASGLVVEEPSNGLLDHLI